MRCTFKSPCPIVYVTFRSEDITQNVNAIVHRLAKFGLVPFADLRVRSLAMK